MVWRVLEQRAAAIVRARLNPENGQHPSPKRLDLTVKRRYIPDASKCYPCALHEGIQEWRCGKR